MIGFTKKRVSVYARRRGEGKGDLNKKGRWAITPSTKEEGVHKTKTVKEKRKTFGRGSKEEKMGRGRRRGPSGVWGS